MPYLVSGQEMKQYDKNTIKYYGVASLVLMERAALAVFSEIERRFFKRKLKILVLCGAGNNGGDGFAVARLLHLAGHKTEIVFPMEEEKLTEDAKAQYRSALKYGIPIGPQMREEPFDVIIDALFGIGLHRAVEGDLGRMIERANRADAYKIAVDISSGVLADTGLVPGAAFRADLTVTFGFAKTGQLFYPGAEYTGELAVADIGIDENSFLGQKPLGSYGSAGELGSLLPERRARSNKGSYGKTLVVAGSKDMAGAAYFAAKAAYYSGCGLVRILTPEENREILLTKLPEAIITPYSPLDEEEMRKSLKNCMQWADAVLIGPGIGTGHAAQALVSAALSYGKKTVCDADALNLMAKDMDLCKNARAKLVVTPHLGEMSRLTGVSVARLQEDLPRASLDFAGRYKAYCVLKDARTVIGMPDGQFFVNVFGNHGMATGGSGDVLAGFLAGFLAQGMDRGRACVLAVSLHGMAGDFAAKEKGAASMLASDILEMLPQAVLAAERGGTVE